jgi:hypothetical protein
MKAESAGPHYFVVTADSDDVSKFVASWPGSGLDEEASYSFTFSAKNGDLVDLWAIRGDGQRDATNMDDGPDLLALSEDAMKFGAIELSLDDVIAIRKIEKGEPALAM